MKYEYFYKEVLPERIRYMDDFWQGKDVPHIPFEVSCWIGDIQNITYLPAMLNQWLTYFNANIPYPGYFIPNFWLYYGNTVCAEILGAKAHRDPPRQPIAIPFIKDDYKKAENIPKPDFDCEVAKKIEEMGTFFRDNFPYDSKPLLTMPDIQGPLDLLAQLWGEEHFFLAFYDCHELVKNTLEKITDGLIVIIEHYKKLFPGISLLFWPPKYSPSDIGAEIAEDHISTVSPDIFEEFILPCWNRISDHFNGLHIHSCGNFEHQIQNFQKVHKLRSLNFSLCQNGSFAQGNSFEKMRLALPETILIPVMDFEGQDRYPTIVEYMEHILSVNEGNKKLYVMVPGTVEKKGVITYQNPEIMEKAYGALEKYDIPRDAGKIRKAYDFGMYYREGNIT